MKRQVIKTNSTVYWLFGFLLVGIVSIVLYVVTNMGLLPPWSLWGIAVAIILIFGIVLLISKGSITLLADRLIIVEGNLEPVVLKVAHIQQVYREIQTNSSYVGGDMNVSTEFFLVFETNNGQQVKINEALYSKKNRARLRNYLAEKRIQVDEK